MSSGAPAKLSLFVRVLGAPVLALDYTPDPRPPRCLAGQAETMLTSRPPATSARAQCHYAIAPFC